LQSLDMATLAAMPTGTVSANATLYGEIVRLAAKNQSTGNKPVAALLATTAAHFAWFDHPGRFVDPDLEALAASLSLPPHATLSRRAHLPDVPERVLHVLTEAHATGGHSRLAWRWMAMDAGRRHSAVLTSQGGRRVPPQLGEAVQLAGGRLYLLGSARGLAGRPAALRGLAHQFDLVILHVHPWDLTPTLAFSADPARPPILLVNHADHVFWLGARLADAVVCLRRSGAELTVRRRGLPEHRVPIVPIPLTVSQPSQTRARARLALGVEADDVLAVSIASAYKFGSMGQLDFPAAALDLVGADRHLRIVVAGPGPQGAWAEVEAASRGRVRAIGPVDDTASLHSAADIYVDSFPIASLTSMLEAGFAGLPVVALQPHPPAASVLQADSPGLDSAVVGASSLAELRNHVLSLATHPQERVRLGTQISEAIASRHTGRAWRAAVDTAYEVALSGRRAGAVDLSEPSGQDELDDLLAELHRGMGGFSQALRAHLWMAPASVRLRVWESMARAHAPLPWTSLLPQPVADALRRRLGR
jgi:glycosyltransferase involved in cell wall biosynthesis